LRELIKERDEGERRKVRPGCGEGGATIKEEGAIEGKGKGRSNLHTGEGGRF
jgi:hypothetical protein